MAIPATAFHDGATSTAAKAGIEEIEPRAPFGRRNEMSSAIKASEARTIIAVTSRLVVADGRDGRSIETAIAAPTTARISGVVLL
jgi:hypothetical protein